MNDYIQKVENAILALSEWCAEPKQFDFFSESDLKCFLYEELVAKQKIDKFIACDKYRISPVHSEVHYDINNKRATADLLIIDQNDFELKQAVKKDGEEDLAEIGFKDKITKSILIELKYFWGRSKNKILEDLSTDVNKLRKNSISKNGFVIGLDMLSKLSENDLKNFEKDSGVRVIYLNRKGDIFSNYGLKK